MEKTLIIIKPDGVCKRLIGKIIDRFESANFRVVGMKMIKLTKEIYNDFYSIHKGKFFFEPYREFMTSAPIVLCVLEGENIIQEVRKIIGNTDSKKAEKGTLRNLFGLNDRRNIIHASDSPDTAKFEINYFFKENDMLEYCSDDWMEKNNENSCFK
ncbi:MAG: nucleoside-diphosphate kinase [Elusimicrobia bacterium RIFOXYD2_FULL_34_15]|nr:MAG: nucleoside-diphosphate kinase [Elusimicrobia bacterium RIFOXYD2_FULL_34_15]